MESPFIRRQIRQPVMPCFIQQPLPLASIDGLTWIIALIPVAVLLWLIFVYNGFVACRNRMRHAMSGIDVQLKKRHDLIPQLVRTVQGYMQHEREVLERVTALRSDAQSHTLDQSSRIQSEQRIGSCIGLIRARAEAYPELRASAQFTMLMRSLNEIEEQISAARRSYNAAVERLNNMVESFPSNIVARMFGFSLADFFAAVESDRANPDVGGLLSS